MIRLDQISKSFNQGRDWAVRDVTLEVREGETLVLLGSSGCGKTTTLKMINRLIEPSKGSIFIDGQDVLRQDPIELRRHIGYVFQGIGLFPHMTVAENVEIVLKLNGVDSAARRQRSAELLNTVGLGDNYADRLPRELSGGQQQRVGVARALAAQPKILLMDEPFGALDAVTRDDLQTELLRLKEKLNKTIVFVTHDIFEAVRLADRIAVLHEGRLEQIGTAQEITDAPAGDFVRELFQRPAEQLNEYKELM